MSTSMNVVGFRPPDETWKKMKEAWDACARAGVEPPKPVLQFFENIAPDPAGVEVRIEGFPAVKSYSADMREGYEVDVTRLPPGVTIVRFFNSY